MIGFSGGLIESIFEIRPPPLNDRAEGSIMTSNRYNTIAAKKSPQITDNAI